MTSFNFLRSSRPEWICRVLDFRVPDRFHAALMALGAAAGSVGGAWIIDNHRLNAARRIETEYRQRFDRSAQALHSTNLYFADVQRLAALDARVREIELSGELDARRLAAIAASFPQHTWITNISRDSTGISLDGQADNLRIVSAVLRNLMREKIIRDPILVDAHTTSVQNTRDIIQYTIHVDATT